MPETPVRFKRIRLTATVEEDLHSGTGSGEGELDGVLLRDVAGRPMVGRTHLIGVLSSGVSDERGTPEFRRLFGEEGSGIREALFTSLRTERTPAVVTWSSTARRSFDNRAPKTDTLRVVEYLGAGTTLVADVELPLECEPLLERALRRCVALGAHRTRSRGRVRWSKEDVVSAPDSDNGLPAGDHTTLRLRLRARDAVTIAATGHAGNLIPTDSYLHGATVRGAFMAWAIRNPSAAAPTAHWATWRFGDAWPVPPGWAASTGDLADWEVLPIPLNLGRVKATASAGDVPWWASPGVDDTLLDRFAHKDAKRPGAHEYVGRPRRSEPWTPFRPQTRAHQRNRVNPGGDPDLFSVEQIVEDTEFVCDLRFDSADERRHFEATFRSVLTGERWLRVGRGGGPVSVEQVTVPQPASGDHVGAVQITLLSDLVVRDRATLDTLDALTSNQVIALFGGTGTVAGAFSESDTAYGYNAYTGLPAMPLRTVRRGTVWRLTGVTNALAPSGVLGERTEEGFGRYRVDRVDEAPGLGARAVGSEPGMVDDRTEESLRAVWPLVQGDLSTWPKRSKWMALRDDAQLWGSAEAANAVLQGLAKVKAWQGPAERVIGWMCGTKGDSLDDVITRVALAVRVVDAQMQAVTASTEAS